ncbi:MAG: response regulator transcription factor [Bacteroidetes bacterium]|nr:response regulator transcription factor [Bacteroidota bacterium]
MVKHILIADDHSMMRQAILGIVKDDWPDAICHEVGDGVRLLERVTQEKWDLVLSDISMPGMNGIEALSAIRKFDPLLPVLIISIHMENRYVVRVLRSGPSGFVIKSRVQDELATAIRMVMEGKSYLSPEMAIRMGNSH